MDSGYPDLLSIVAHELQKGLQEQPPVEWDPETWLVQFPAGSSVADHVLALGGQRLDRQLLRSLADEVAAASGLSLRTGLLERLFVWTQVWGYGRVGYGAYRVRQIMSHSGFPCRLRTIYEVLMSDGALAAYSAMMRGAPANLPGLGQSFATKFLYFAGYDRAPAAALRPIILDRFVGVALREGAPSVFGCRTGIDWSINDYREYLSAVDWLCRQSCLAGITPDEVELTLFRRGAVSRAL